MIISSSSVTMSSQHNLVERSTEQESLRVWVDNERSNSENQDANLGQQAKNLITDTVDLSDLSKTAYTASTDNDNDYGLSPSDKLKISIIESLLEAMTGKKVKIRVLDKVDLSNNISSLSLRQLNSQTSSAPQRKGWGLAYDYSESHYENEQTNFQASGVIRTADGKTIDFSTQMRMSRTFTSEHHISVRAGDAKIDPLVINFGGKAAELTDKKYSFDLDSDGKNDYISFVGSGSGFLALDKNRDGVINNGTELFGPSSGSGFQELSAYDDDHNGWIDERDAVYQQLNIWTKDESGQDQLSSLAEKGIGAIYLANVDTDFTYKNTANESLGQVRSSGIFVAEKGTVGTVQQIDLIV